MLFTILSGINGITDYLNDVIIYVKTKCEHDQEREKCGIKLNDKCQFAKQSLTFLANTISSDRIQIDEDKIKSIRSMLALKDENSLM